jgi:hypothetical protein
MFNVFSWVEISYQFEQIEIMHSAVVVAVGLGDDSHQFCCKMTPMLVKKMNI